MLPKIGKLGDWSEYKRLKLDPINKHFEYLDQYPYSQLRENYNFTFKITTSWEEWSKCDACGHQKGIRRKIGKCHLRPVPHNHTELVIPFYKLLTTSRY